MRTLHPDWPAGRISAAVNSACYLNGAHAWLDELEKRADRAAPIGGRATEG